MRRNVSHNHASTFGDGNRATPTNIGPADSDAPAVRTVKASERTVILMASPSANSQTVSLRDSFHSVFDALVSQLDALSERVAALEAERSSVSSIVAFCERRPSWTVKQLAEDLNVHPNTVLNWLALPDDHPRHLESFQPGGAGPHMIMPEHVADWMSRNGQQVA